MCDKKELRKQYQAQRKAWKDPEKDRLIAQAALKAFSAERYFCYLSFGSEVGTELLIKELKARGALVCVPKILGRDMLSIPLEGKLTLGAYGISEPEGGTDTLCEIALTPLLAVDKDGYRLGYGGGYYDRYFARHPEIYKVGICYEAQKVERLPREETDIPLDALVTECGVSFLRKK